MKEGPNNEIEQIENELTQEHNDAVESLFTDGKPKTEEEELLKNYVSERFATGDKPENLGAIVQEFNEKRADVVGEGIDPNKYSINKEGTVLTDSEAKPE